MEQPEDMMSPELLAEMEDLQEEQMQNQQDAQNEGQMEMSESGYGYPEPEEKYNQHRFIAKSVFESPDVEKVSYLKQEELGRPLFNVRFLLDMEDIAKHYLDPLIKQHDLQMDNRISVYFRNKIDNICSSGLSNNGFIQTINVSKKIDIARTKSRGNVENLKVGDERRRKK